MTIWTKTNHSVRLAPLSVVKKTGGVDYIADFLEIIDLPTVRMTEVLGREEPCFYIRHDVDHDIEMAMVMAEVEARAGFSATFFLLTPGSYRPNFNYYGAIEDNRIVHDSKLIDYCKRMVDLGHDLGFHNDLVSLSFRIRRDPGDILREEVDFFDRHGIKLVGTAAHGNPLARKLGFVNMEIFESCARKERDVGRVLDYGGWQVQLHSLRLKDFGFEFEAYSLPRDSAISDSGSRWGGKIAGYRPDWSTFNANFDLKEFKRFVQMARAENGVRHFSVMTHPNHWRAVCSQ